MDIRPFVDLYEVLGVSHDASEEDIKGAFRDLAKKLHPDKNPDGAEAFCSVMDAFRILSNPDYRKQYDESGFVHTIPEEMDMEIEAKKSLFIAFKQVMTNVIERGNMDSENVVARMREIISGAKVNIETSRFHLSLKQDRLANFKKRLKIKDSSFENHIMRIISDEEISTKKEHERFGFHIKVSEMALKMVDVLEYSCDGPYSLLGTVSFFGSDLGT